MVENRFAPLHHQGCTSSTTDCCDGGGDTDAASPHKSSGRLLLPLELDRCGDTSTHVDGDRSPSRLKGSEHHHHHTHHETDGMGGDLQSAVLGIIKAMVGPAILYLPHGFAHAGWVVAIPILFLSTALFLASSACLLETWKLVESTKIICTSADSADEEDDDDDGRSNSKDRAKREGTGIMDENGVQSLSYPDLAYRAFGSKGEAVVKIGIAAMQSGVCLTYLIFVPHNLHSSMKSLSGRDVSPTFFLILMLGLQVPLSWIRDIRKLSVTNAFANALIFYGLITCLGFAFSTAAQPVIEEESTAKQLVSQGGGGAGEIMNKVVHLEPFNSSGWFLFIGTSVLLFEGSITLLIPLQEAVDTEEDRKLFPILYPKVILGIIGFYTFFGIFCWAAFGQDVDTVMTVNLPDGTLATTVQMAYSVAVMFTFPLQNFPSLEISCSALASLAQSSRNLRYLGQRNFVASLLICVLGLVAVLAMERLDKVVSLMGGLLGCPLAFCIPPLIQNELDARLSAKRRLQNKIVSFLGFCAMVMATVATILKW